MTSWLFPVSIVMPQGATYLLGQGEMFLLRMQARPLEPVVYLAVLAVLGLDVAALVRGRVSPRASAASPWHPSGSGGPAA